MGTFFFYEVPRIVAQVTFDKHILKDVLPNLMFSTLLSDLSVHIKYPLFATFTNQILLLIWTS